MFGAFDWSTTVLKAVVIGCLVLHGLCFAAIVNVVSEHRTWGSAKGLALQAALTAPAFFLGYLAFFVGTKNPTGLLLPGCLLVLLAGTWGGASVARRMLRQDSSEPKCKPFDCTSGGRNVYVKNSHNDRLVRVTIKITEKTSYADPRTWSIVRNIEAGDRRLLGCNRCTYSRTVGNRANPAFWHITREVVGCRVIE